MSDLIETQAKDTSEGTSFRKFLADRGVVMVKEFRPIGKFKGRFLDTLICETMLLTIIKSNKRKTSYGVKLERHDSDDDLDSSVFLDFDELDELLDALRFIRSTAKELLGQERDHTEVTYATKDQAKVGFYQTSEEQQAFFALSMTGTSIFLPVERLSEIVALITKARDHLISCGAQP